METGRADGTAARRWRWAGVAVSFLVLCALWLWCERGGSSLIRIVASGDKITVFLDGRLIVEGRDAGLPTEGGVGVWYDREHHWGFPVPQTLQSARVTDNASHALLLTQDFRKPLSDAWAERPGSCAPSGEGLRCDRARPVRLCTGSRDWKDYTLELRVRNPTAMEVAVRYRDPANHAVFFLRPFRELDSGITFVTGGARRNIAGERPYYAVTAEAKNILLVFLHWFPWCALAVVALAAAGRLIGFVAAHFKVPRGAFELLFLYVLFAGGFVYLSWITRSLLDGIPHVQDSVVYNFQARTLARGALYSPAPPVPEAFGFDFLIVKDGKWFGQYPWGHPFLLMFGHLLHRPWIIPPLVGASVLVLIYLIARELFSRETAALSALLALSSPFFQINASNFMSHNSASFYLALGVLFLVKAPRAPRPSRQALYGFLSGVALGALFNTRPLHAIPALALTGGMFLYYVLARRVRLRALFAFSAGALLLLAFFLYGNYAVMGNAFDIPYRLVGNDAGFFGDRNPLGLALSHYYASLTLFVMVVFGWPPVYTSAFFLAFVLCAKKKAENVYLLLLLAGVTGANLFYTLMASPGHMYGPRFMYEVFPLFVIMSACGWDSARRLFEDGIAACARSFPLRARVLSWLAHAVFLALPAMLVFGAQQKWLSRSDALFDFAFMPPNIYGMKGFNYISGAMIEKVRSQGIHHAVIFVEDREPDWWYYGALFTLNSPFLDSDIIVARDRGDAENRRVIAAFPGRALYRAMVKRMEIRNYT
ncbi:MAG: glycosyltransferase family 39 protein [Chlamydiota bacterium]